MPPIDSAEMCRKMMRILIFSLPGIGDTLLFLPALRVLRKAMPGAHITVVTMFEGSRAVVELAGDADEAVNFEFWRNGAWQALRFVLGLRKRRFDACILAYPANRPEYNLIARLSCAKVRLGHRYNHLGFVCLNWLQNRLVHEDDSLTNIEENLRLAELLAGQRSSVENLRLRIPDPHARRANAWLDERGLARTRPLIGFHPGGSTRKNHEHKRWPAERFGELGAQLLKKTAARILIFGGDKERDVKESIAGMIGAAACTVDTEDFSLSAALIGQCDHFVSNDTALLHLAAFLGVPATGIFGPTNAAWVRVPGAWRQEATLGLPCQPCFYYSPRHLRCAQGDFQCLSGLSTGHVLDLLLQALESEKPLTFRE